MILPHERVTALRVTKAVGIIDYVRSAPRLTKEQQRALIAKAQSGDLAARDTLIHAHIQWVLNIARRSVKRVNVPWDDLFQVGVLGIIHAIEKFDLSKNTTLMTYATFWIRNNIQQENELRSTVIRLPSKESRSQLHDLLAKERAEDIWKGLLSLDYTCNVRKNTIGRGSNDGEDPKNKRAKDFLASGSLVTEDTHEEALETTEIIETLKDGMTRLPAHQLFVLKERMAGKPLHEIAKGLGITAEATRQRYLRAEEFLRRFLEGRGIDYL